MTQYAESFEDAVSRMGEVEARTFACEVATLLARKGLSLSQAEAVLEIAKDLLRSVPLERAKKSDDCKPAKHGDHSEDC